LRRNWDYEYFPRHAHPHGITFTRCAETGIHEYKFRDSTNITSWHLRDDIVGWLETIVGLDHCTFDALVPYAVNFANKADAMLFKLTHSAGSA
jgi:hypothetical protein